jgi:hypothetical protein
LLRPLFITSWLIDDFLADNDFFGARIMLLSSASSKTAYGTAFQLAQREGIEVVGLTSPGNVAFCESLGCYSRVLTYDQLDAIDADAACVYVDFAGNSDLRRAIHTRFVNLKHSSSIGGTHVEHLGAAKDLPGPRATLFFAPAQVKKRATEWGPAGAEPAPGRGLAGFFKGGGAARHALARGADASRPRGRGGRLRPGAVGPWRPAPGAHAAGLGRRTA